jgi:hypothetical protein
MLTFRNQMVQQELETRHRRFRGLACLLLGGFRLGKDVMRLEMKLMP